MTSVAIAHAAPFPDMDSRAEQGQHASLHFIDVREETRVQTGVWITSVLWNQQTWVLRHLCFDLQHNVA